MRILRMQILITIAFSLSGLFVNAQTASEFQTMDGHPMGEDGYAKGVSGCFAGIVDGWLIMAGGCNFPEQPAADGGRKRYYRNIYAAKISKECTLQWRKIGELPHVVAYGVTVPVKDGLLFIGGCNERQSLANVYKLKLKNNRAVLDTLPSLPFPMDNFVGARHGNVVEIYGGKLLLSLNLKQQERGWRLKSVQDIERVQPIGGFVNGRFHVWGGFSPKQKYAAAVIPDDGLCFGTTTCHLQAPHDEAGNLLFGAGGAVASLGKRQLLAIGGVHEKIFLQALNAPQSDYLAHDVSWYQFNPCILTYSKTGWKIIGRSQQTARAGAALVMYKQYVYVIGGELKPGIRTSEIVRFRIR